MAFKENETVYIEDAGGKRHWVRVAPGMVRVQSLGHSFEPCPKHRPSFLP